MTDGSLGLQAYQVYVSGDFEAAKALYRRHLADCPDDLWANVNLGNLLLMSGQYQEGFARMNIRGKTQDMMQHLISHLGMALFRTPDWDGSPTKRDVVVVGEQGLGDTILAARYLPWAADRCSRLIVLTHMEGLERTLMSIEPRIVIPPKGTPTPADASYCLMTNLPGLALSQGQSLLTAPYLSADPDRRRESKAYFVARPGLHVGLCWRTYSGLQWHTEKNIPLGDMMPRFRRPGVTFHALGLAPIDAEAEGVAPDLLPNDLSERRRTAEDSLQEGIALLAAMDRVITIDTAIAHLAGAAGVPGMVLVPAVPFWPWGASGTVSPLYPSLRLFRADTAKGFAPALADLEVEFDEWLAHRTS